jgi:hypothetical protein
MFASWGDSWGASWSDSWGYGVIPPPVVVDDTHDGDYLRKKLKREREEVEARRRRVLELYERIVEGLEPAPEEVEQAVSAAIEAVGVETRADIIEAPSIDLGRILAGLERALDLQRRLALEADDEEVMLLL